MERNHSLGVPARSRCAITHAMSSSAHAQVELLLVELLGFIIVIIIMRLYYYIFHVQSHERDVH